MVNLPPEFLDRMKALLGNEYPEYESVFSKPAFRGLRLNPLKCGETVLKSSLPFPITPAPFSPLEYYIPNDIEKIGMLPMHHAGGFYVQEPSASSAVTALDPQPGDKVLDLCAAPGGKSTQIASLLQGKGLLWSNEVVRSRAGILLSNLERLGVANAIVSCCHPEKLCQSMAGFFDKVLVDAPCSGEGMFRRNEQAVYEWSTEHVKSCAERQLAILQSAASAVKENGILVYSTCTYSKEENEGVILNFLSKRDDFELINCKLPFGRPAFIPEARRIFPMDGGEGHFVAVLRRLSANSSNVERYHPAKCTDMEPAIDLYSRIFKIPFEGEIVKSQDSFYIIPESLPGIDGLGVIRAGILLGKIHTNRVEPEHALFMAARPEYLVNVIDFAHDSLEIFAFLRGEEITVPDSLRGYTGVSADGVMVGFGKCSNGRLKNHYPKGLRNLL